MLKVRQMYSIILRLATEVYHTNISIDQRHLLRHCQYMKILVTCVETIQFCLIL